MPKKNQKLKTMLMLIIGILKSMCRPIFEYTSKTRVVLPIQQACFENCNKPLTTLNLYKYIAMIK